MSCVYVTKHGGQRVKERTGLPRKSVISNVEKALLEGLKHSEVSGSLKRYIDYLFLQHKKGNNIRIYGNMVYIFDNNALITAFLLPRKYIKTANAIKKGREGA